MSGSDDNSFKIWDLRNFKPDAPAAHFTYHRGPITSVEWDPNEESTLAVCGADNQITVWDLSLEKDDEEAERQAGVEVPPQLLFVHMGMKNMKELHWHPQMLDTLVCTAEDGLNVFTPDLE